MSDPVSGTSIIVAGGLMGAGMFGLVTGIDYGVVLGLLPARYFMLRRRLISRVLDSLPIL